MNGGKEKQKEHMEGIDTEGKTGGTKHRDTPSHLQCHRNMELGSGMGGNITSYLKAKLQNQRLICRDAEPDW